MGIDHAERGRLVLQVDEDAHQHDVLDDVGEAASMKGVSVVHADCGSWKNIRIFYSSCPGLSRASTSSFALFAKYVDGRDKPGHDGGALTHPGSAASSPGHAGR